MGELSEGEDELPGLLESLTRILRRRTISAFERSPDTLFGELFFLNTVLELRERVG